MANTTKAAGINSYILWKKESTYATPVTPDAHFGIDTDFNYTLNNQLKPRRGFKGSTGSGRDVAQYTSGILKADITINGDFNSAALLEPVLGTYLATVYSGSDNPPSVTIAACIDNTTTDRDMIFSGVVFQSLELKATMGDPLTFNLTGEGILSSTDATLTANAAPINAQPWTFTGSTFELPNATPITNLVEDFTLNIKNNWTLLYGSSRVPVAAVAGIREYSITLNTKYIDDAIFTKAYGTPATEPTLNATMELHFTRPTGTHLTILCAITPIDTYKLTMKHGNAIAEDITLIPASMTITDA